MCYILAYGTSEQLKNFVAEPEVFIPKREELPSVSTNAIPVYLDVASGKILVSTSVLDAVAERGWPRGEDWSISPVSTN